MKRDLYIDYAKGFATLSVIFIHTVFWSGQFYVPSELRILSLLIDVPLFYALSGITSSGNLDKTFYRLLKLQITYMIFVTFLFFADYFFKIFSLHFWGLEWINSFYSTFGTKYLPQNISTVPQWQNLGNWYLHSYTNADTFPVVMGSFWYLKVYFIITILGVLILRFLPKHVNFFIALCIALTVIFNIFPHYYPTGQVGYSALYLGIFLIANTLKGKKIERTRVLFLYALSVVSLIALFYTYGADIFHLINKQKFPPKTPYIIWSSLSLITLFILYNRLKINKNSLITYIGKNAIFYYFAQGISSSLIYFFVSEFKGNMHWIPMLFLTFLLNIILAILIAEFLKKIDSLGWSVLTKTKNR